MENRQSLHTSLAENLLEIFNIKYYNCNLYVYNNGIYSKDTTILEKKMIELDENVTRQTRKETLEYLKIKLSGKNITLNKNYINFKNCLYDLKNNIIIPHSPNVFTLNQINANYLKEVNTNHYVENYLDKITSGNTNRKRAILEIIGYCMSPNTDLQKAFIFYGPSADNGKSTLLNIINTLIGENNICHVSLHDLQNGRFYAAEIENKLLNSVLELSRKHLDSIEIFKGIVTGDAISIENKYEKRHSIYPYAKHIFTANEIPIVEDKTNGFYRRLNILKFEQKYTNEEKRDFDINKLLTQNSLDYLANISLEAYIELINTRVFANNDESNEILAVYKSADSSLQTYLISNEFKALIYNKHNIMLRKNLYSNYRDFCVENSYPLIGQNSFYDKIRSSQLFNDITIQGKRYFRYINIVEP